MRMASATKLVVVTTKRYPAITAEQWLPQATVQVLKAALGEEPGSQDSRYQRLLAILAPPGLPEGTPRALRAADQEAVSAVDRRLRRCSFTVPSGSPDAMALLLGMKTITVCAVPERDAPEGPARWRFVHRPPGAPKNREPGTVTLVFKRPEGHRLSALGVTPSRARVQDIDEAWRRLATAASSDSTWQEVRPRGTGGHRAAQGPQGGGSPHSSSAGAPRGSPHVASQQRQPPPGQPQQQPPPAQPSRRQPTDQPQLPSQPRPQSSQAGEGGDSAMALLAQLTPEQRQALRAHFRPSSPGGSHSSKRSQSGTSVTMGEEGRGQEGTSAPSGESPAKKKQAARPSTHETSTRRRQVDLSDLDAIDQEDGSDQEMGSELIDEDPGGEGPSDGCGDSAPAAGGA